VLPIWPAADSHRIRARSIYNFSVARVAKAWIDLVADASARPPSIHRSRPEGLVKASASSSRWPPAAFPIAGSEDDFKHWPNLKAVLGPLWVYDRCQHRRRRPRWPDAMPKHQSRRAKKRSERAQGSLTVGTRGGWTQSRRSPNGRAISGKHHVFRSLARPEIAPPQHVLRPWGAFRSFNAGILSSREPQTDRKGQAPCLRIFLKRLSRRLTV